MNRITTKILVTAAAIIFLTGWGGVGHKIISQNTELSFPSELNFLTNWPDSLAKHASDADFRKDDDPDEAPKHYIDIDSYPEFVTNGRISQNYDSIVAQHGAAFVIDQGILPWAIITTYDSLKACFKRQDFHKAMIHAADLGHYVGDGHMPLHITTNYNGQLTGQSGIHSRYESTMIGKYTGEIIYTGDTAKIINNIQDFVFNFVYKNHYLKDSLLAADIYAKGIAGNTSSNTYYLELWKKTKTMTIDLMKNASIALTSLIYTAWKKSQEQPSFIGRESRIVKGFAINNNYPNPFNPSTVISFTLPEKGNVTLKVYDISGKEIKEIFNGTGNAGINRVNFNAAGLSSGVYFYKVFFGKGSLTGKMILAK